MDNKEIKILVIEDDLIVSMLLKHKIKQLKPNFKELQVKSVDSLKEGFLLIKSGKFVPHLITLDLNLSEKEPSEYTLTQIPELSKTAPVMVISAALTPEDGIKTALKSGAEDFVDKRQINSEILLERILVMLYRHHCLDDC